MERVAFLVEETGERIDCLLNPQTLEMKRVAGVRPRGTAGGQLVGAGRADDPLLFTGGGRTEIVLDLVFDVEMVESKAAPEDVRTLTRRLWTLSENSSQERGSVRPPAVRLVWGKTWNVPGVIGAVAERFDAIGPTGVPRRSWMRLKLMRVEDPAGSPAAMDEFAEPPARAVPAATGAVQALGDGRAEPGFSGVRFDLLADDALGSPLRWRRLADHNGIANPLDIRPGRVLSVPGRTGGRR
jgi:hypothetical protein